MATPQPLAVKNKSQQKMTQVYTSVYIVSSSDVFVSHIINLTQIEYNSYSLNPTISRSSQCSTALVCYTVCGIMHIKEPLLLFGKSSQCGGSRVPLTEWSFTCRHHITINKMC